MTNLKNNVLAEKFDSKAMYNVEFITTQEVAYKIHHNYISDIESFDAGIIDAEMRDDGTCFRPILRVVFRGNGDAAEGAHIAMHGDVKITRA